MLSSVSCIFGVNDDYDKGVEVGGTYSISGKFVDNSGKPIVGLTVQLTGKSQTSALTDVTGSYIFGDLEAGSYTVIPGNSSYGPKDISVTSGNVDVGTNNDGHGLSKNGDYSCLLCH